MKKISLIISILLAATAIATTPTIEIQGKDYHYIRMDGIYTIHAMDGAERTELNNIIQNGEFCRKCIFCGSDNIQKRYIEEPYDRFKNQYKNNIYVARPNSKVKWYMHCKDCEISYRFGEELY